MGDIDLSNMVRAAPWRTGKRYSSTVITWAVWKKIGGGLTAGMLLLAACTQRPGGALTDEWPEMPEPSVQVPLAGTCHQVGANGYGESFAYTMLQAVPACDASHKFETIYVGQFDGEHATRTTPPPDGGPAARLAYRRCADVAREFLGGDWHAAWIWLSVFVPSEAAWAGGARWFRCDLAETRNGANVIEDRTASMRDGLRGERPLAITCARGDLERSSSLYDGSCTENHTLEFVGVYVPTAADLAVGENNLGDRLIAGCWKLAAPYLGLPLNRVPDELFAYFWYFKDDRPRGEFTVRCFVGPADPDKPIRGGATLKGLGSRPLPTTG